MVFVSFFVVVASLSSSKGNRQESATVLIQGDHRARHTVLRHVKHHVKGPNVTELALNERPSEDFHQVYSDWEDRQQLEPPADFSVKEGLAWLLDKAHAVDQDFCEYLEKLLHDLKVVFPNERLYPSLPGVKSPLSAGNKCNRYGLRSLWDLVRASIIFDSEDPIRSIIAAVELMKNETRSFVIASTVNRFDQATSLGYRDMQLILRHTASNFKVELQLHVCHVIKFKELEGHALYNQWKQHFNMMTEAKSTLEKDDGSRQPREWQKFRETGKWTDGWEEVLSEEETEWEDKLIAAAIAGQKVQNMSVQGYDQALDNKGICEPDKFTAVLQCKGRGGGHGGGPKRQEQVQQH